VTLSFTTSLLLSGDCGECVAFAEKSIQQIVEECDHLLRITPGKVLPIYQAYDESELDRQVHAPDQFPLVSGPEYTWKDNLVIFAAVVCTICKCFSFIQGVVLLKAAPAQFVE
jgi:hypothetical protein